MSYEQTHDWVATQSKEEASQPAAAKRDRQTIILNGFASGESRVVLAEEAMLNIMFKTHGSETTRNLFKVETGRELPEMHRQTDALQDVQGTGFGILDASAPAFAAVARNVIAESQAWLKRSSLQWRAALAAVAGLAMADDATVQTETAVPPLMEAARADDAARVAALLSAGADPHASVAVNDGRSGLSFGDTALSVAARHASPAVASLLIEADVEVNAETHYHITPLANAAASNSAAMVELLVQAGANLESPDVTGRTPLMLAALSNDVVVAQRLLALGADLGARDEGGRNPLMWAVGANSRAMAEMLIAAGDNLRHVTDYGETVLMAAAGSRRVEGEVIVWLLEQGLDVNAVDSHGETVLTRAAGWSRPEVVRMLLDHGADATLRTHDGRLAADFAADNPDIHRTNVYWRLNDARFE